MHPMHPTYWASSLHTAHCRVPGVPLWITWLRGAEPHCRYQHRGRRWQPEHHQHREYQDSKFRVWLLLDIHSFQTIIKLKNHEQNHSQGPCVPVFQSEWRTQSTQRNRRDLAGSHPSCPGLENSLVMPNPALRYSGHESQNDSFCKEVIVRAWWHVSYHCCTGECSEPWLCTPREWSW